MTAPTSGALLVKFFGRPLLLALPLNLLMCGLLLWLGTADVGASDAPVTGGTGAAGVAGGDGAPAAAAGTCALIFC